MRFTSTIERVVSIGQAIGGRCLIPVFALSDFYNVFNVFISYTHLSFFENWLDQRTFIRWKMIYFNDSQNMNEQGIQIHYVI